MRFLFFLLVLSVFSNADYLAIRNNNHCVIDLAPNQDDIGWCFHDQSEDSDICESNRTIDDFVAGYYYDGSDCLLKNDLKVTGLTQNQWSYIMAIIANVIGFVFVFLVGFSAFKVSKKA